MPSARTPTPGDKPCAQCGKPITRSLREGNKRYEARRYCSRACGNEAQADAPIAQIPCKQCGKIIPRNPRDSRWKHAQRRYCSVVCASHGGHEARWSFNTRNRQKLAPEGYVFDGRFPTPAGLRSTWQPVTGPDTGCTITFRHNTVTKRPETNALLARALSLHPDLLSALSGTLSDSWVQQDAATYTG